MTEYEINELSKKQLKIIDDKLGGNLTFCIKKRINNLQKENEKLKEQIPQWHDLRKDPDDLPKHSGLYCVQCGEVREYVKEEKSWFTVHFEPCINRTEETYLWCELPKFEE